MNPLLPFFFTALSLFNIDDGSVGLRIETNRPYYDSDTIDIVRHHGLTAVSVNVTSRDNATRRYVTSLDTQGRLIDVTDAGPAETKGAIDDIYITDADGNTIDVVFTVADAEPAFSNTPEGGLAIGLTDRVSATVAGHDHYILRYTSVVKHIDEAGIFSLLSIRPTTDELDAFVSKYNLYDRRGSEDIPMDAAALRIYLLSAFPLPGSTSR